MALDLSSLNIRKKPGPTARYRAKRRRAEGPVAKKVRAACVERDGECRICNWEDNPDDIHYEPLPYAEDEWSNGPSQWAHMRESSRAKTRGMKPEDRHSTLGTLMLCEFHHDRYDGRRRPRIQIVATSELGADGPLEIS